MALDIQPTDLEKAWNWFQAQPRGWQAIITAGAVFVLSTIAALFSWRFFFRSRLKAKDVALTALARSKDHIIEEKTATIERLDSHMKLMEAAANRGASVRNQEQQAPDATSQFRNVDDFYRTYDNVMLREIEANIRKLAAEYRPGDEREGYLVRTSATVIVLALFEYIWRNIFQSQINVLEALNTKVMHVDDLNAFYEEGKARTPIAYVDRSFAAWLWFLRGSVLILEQGETVQITVRGKEFLKYLIEHNYDKNTRIG